MLGNPSVAAFVEHHTLLYDDLRDPVALLRGETTTRLSDFWPYAKGDESDEAACGPYSDLMARSQKLIAQDVLDAYPFGRHQCLLDIGGGEGAFVAAVAARHPALRLQLFDLPPVAARASRLLAAQGLSRVEIHSGSFLEAPPPTGADVVTLIRVLHDHDDAKALAALARRLRRPASWRHAGHRRTHGADARRGSDRRRLFRLLFAGDGQRPPPPPR